MLFYTIVGAIIGFLVSLIVMMFIFRICDRIDGELQIDDFGDEKDIYRFVIYHDIEKLKKQNTTRFKVISTHIKEDA